MYMCMSEECYQEVYGPDPLEEGEIDTERSRKFDECFKHRARQKQKSET